MKKITLKWLDLLKEHARLMWSKLVVGPECKVKLIVTYEADNSHEDLVHLVVRIKHRTFQHERRFNRDSNKNSTWAPIVEETLDLLMRNKFEEAADKFSHSNL